MISAKMMKISALVNDAFGTSSEHVFGQTALSQRSLLRNNPISNYYAERFLSKSDLKTRNQYLWNEGHPPEQIAAEMKEACQVCKKKLNMPLDMFSKPADILPENNKTGLFGNRFKGLGMSGFSEDISSIINKKL